MRTLWPLVVLCIIVSLSEGSTYLPPFDDPLALQLNSAAQQYLTLPTITVGGSFAVDFLYRWRSNPTYGNNNPILYLANGPKSSSKELFAIRTISDGHGGALLAVDICSPQGQCATALQSNNSLVENTWTYVVILVTAIDNTKSSVTFYTQPFGSAVTTSSGTFFVSVPCTIGTKSVGYFGFNPAINAYLNGDLDEFRIWNTKNINFAFFQTVDPNNQYLLCYYRFVEAINRWLDNTKNCHHAGFAPGPHAPIWIPSGFLRVRSCEAWGHRVYFKTFDGRVYSEPKLNIYTFAQISPATSSLLASELNVQIRVDSQVYGSGASVTGVAFKYFNDVVAFDLDYTFRTDTDVFVNGQSNPNDLIVLSSGLIIYKQYTASKQTYYVQASDWRMRIIAYPRKRESYVSLKVTQNDYINDNMLGLCGNFNGNKNDDVGVETNPAFIAASSSLFPPAQTPSGDTTSFGCSIPASSSLYAPANTACSTSIFTSDFTAACLFDICVLQDPAGASTIAAVAYAKCLEDNANSTSNPCPAPCPGFCSFHGTCLANATCACNSGFGGADCSQPSSYRCYTASWKGGSQTYSLTPFTGSQTVSSYYSYNYPFPSSGDTGNEVSNSGVFFLYNQNTDNNSLSFFFINDQIADGSGGNVKATFSATNGATALPFTIAVKDDPGDTYSPNGPSIPGGSVSTTWSWDACCTDGIAITGANWQTSNFCVNMAFTKTQGLSQMFAASQNLFGEEDLQVIPLTDITGLKVCGATCTDTCGQWGDCGSCSAHSGCGWCVDTQTCQLGTSGGPSLGRCLNWKFNNSVSRVVSTSIDYPIDPSSADVILVPGSNVNVNFFVNFPDYQNIPLQIVLLIDTSSGASSVISFLKSNFLFLYYDLLFEFPETSVGIATFSDRPVKPYGKPNAGDLMYQTMLPISTSFSAIQSALNGITVADGGDDPNAQLQALLTLVETNAIGFSPNARKMVFIITTSSFHTPIGSPYTVNPGDGSCTNTIDYPSAAQVYNALIDNDVIPIFVAKNDYANGVYNDLVNSWNGYGFIAGFSNSFAGLINCADGIADAFYQVASTATVILANPGKVTAVSASYSGINPESRVLFTATVSPSVADNTSAILIVPGFGSLTINYVTNDAPTPGSCTVPFAFCGNSTTTTIMLSGASSVIGDVLTFQITSLPQNGQLFQFDTGLPINAGDYVTDTTNQVVYVPNAICTGTMDSFTFDLCDGCASCSTQTVCSFALITVANPPPAPVATGATIETTFNTLSASTLLAGTVVGNGTVQAVIDVLPMNGKLYQDDGVTQIIAPNTIVTDNNVKYLPPFNQFGVVDTFLYKVTANGVTSTSDAQVTCIVDNLTPPTAVSFTQNVTEDITASVVLQSPDAINSPIFNVMTGPQNGTLSTTQNVGGAITVFPALNVSATLYYIPPPGVSGITVTFTYVVCHSLQPAVCSSASTPATVTLGPIIFVNHLPVATAQTYNVFEDNTTLLALTAVDQEDGTNLVFYITSWSAQGTLTDSSGSVISSGPQMTQLPTASVKYLSPLHKTGSLDSFTFIAIDRNGGQSNSAVCPITVLRVNYPPTGTSSSVQQGAQFKNSTIVLSGQDLNADTMSFSICALPTGTLFNIDGSALTLNQIVKSVTQTGGSFAASASFLYFTSGTGIDSFGYSVGAVDGNTSCITVSINITASNPPTASPTPSSLSVVEDSTTGVRVRLGGSASTGSFSSIVSAIPSASLGTLYQVDASNNTNLAAPIASTPTTVTSPYQFVQFIPVTHVYGSDSLSYYVQDTNGLKSTVVNVPITVTFKNHAPTVSGASYNMSENSVQIIQFVGNDVENGTNLSWYVSSLPAVGALSACNNASCTSTAPINTVPFLVPSGVVLFAPQSFTFNTPYASFTFFANDKDTTPLASANATITISVFFVDTAPSVVTPTEVFTINDSTNLNIFLNGTDPDSPRSSLTVKIITITPTGAGSLFTTTGTQLNAGSTFSDPNQQCLYVPVTNPSNTNVTVTVKIIFDIIDPQGMASQNGEVDINVTPSPRAPTATSISTAPAPSGTNQNITLTGVDPNGGNLTFIITSTPSVGSLTQTNGNPITSGSVVNGNTVTFITTPCGFGSPMTTFTYIAQNSAGLNSSASVVSINYQRSQAAPSLTPTGNTGFENSITFFTLNPFSCGGYAINITILDFDTAGIGSFWQVGPDNHSIINDTQSGGAIDPNQKINYIQNAAGYVAFVPLPFLNDDFNNQAPSIDFSASDTQNRTTGTSFFVFILNVPNAPVASQASPTTITINNNAPMPMALTLKFSDADSVDTLPAHPDNTVWWVNLVIPPANGDVYGRNDYSFPMNLTFPLSDPTGDDPNTPATFFYSVKPSQYGASGTPYDTFIVNIKDQDGLYSNNITYVININFINHPPVPGPNTIATLGLTYTEDVSSNQTLLLNASDVDTGDFPAFTTYEFSAGAPNFFLFQQQKTAALWQTISFAVPISTIITYFSTLAGYSLRIGLNASIAAAKNYNTVVNPPLQWCVALGCFSPPATGGCGNQTNYHNSFPICYPLFITPVNDAPAIACTKQGCAGYTAFNNVIMDVNDISVTDVDCPPGFNGCTNQMTINITITQNTSKVIMYLNSPSGLINLVNTSTSIVFNATLAVLNSTLNSGIFVYATGIPSGGGSAKIVISVNDGSNFPGNTGPALSTSQTLTVTFTSGSPPANYPYAAPATGAMLGGTGIISTGVYILYRAMKKRKMLPEDANPWEADEGFDNTLDNPLYTGTPTTSSATRVTLVTRD